MSSAATPVSQKCLRRVTCSSERRLGDLKWDMTTWTLEHTDGAITIPLLPLSQLFLGEESTKFALGAHGFQFVVYV